MEEKNQEQQALQQIIDLGAATTKSSRGDDVYADDHRPDRGAPGSAGDGENDEI